MRSVQASQPALPRAFARPATRFDALPPSPFFKHGLRNPTGPAEKILATRRIAAYTDSRGRRALLYLIRTSKQICEFTFWRGGAGGGCNDAASFFAGRHVVAGSGHLITGVADDSVTTLVVVGTHGGRHRVTPTSDGGFIYDCRAYSGCTGCVVDHVEAFDSAGQRVEVDRVTGRCTRKR